MISAIAILLISNRSLRVADLALEFALGLIDLACRLRRMISRHLANVLLDDALRLVQRAFRAILSHCSHLSLQRLVEPLDAGQPEACGTLGQDAHHFASSSLAELPGLAPP